MIRTCLLLTLFLWISIVSVYAQVPAVTISGIVKNKSDKSAIAYVNVIV